ncbi:hypothetical protein [Streptodolium elevatio]|uniref:Uncharacterized protein n=1 Tax=Streptodolium elevatio TaxID=3157996 RepID=A0ABV3DL79_9ACTN
MTTVRDLTSSTSYARLVASANASMRLATASPLVEAQRSLGRTTAGIANQAARSLATQQAWVHSARVLTKSVDDLIAQTSRPFHENLAKSLSTVVLPRNVPNASDIILSGLKPALDAHRTWIGGLSRAMSPSRDWAASMVGIATSASVFRTRIVRTFVGRLFSVVCQVKQAVLDGDLEPVGRFIARYLNVPPTPDRMQSLALELLDGRWIDEVDVGDDAAVLKKLRRLTNRDNGTESDRTVGGRRILVLPEFWIPDDVSVPGPEDEAIARVLAPEDQFDDPRVPRALRRLKTDADRAVAYTYAKNDGISWGEAAVLTNQRAQRGEATRTALKRAGRLINQRDRAWHEVSDRSSAP